MPMKSSIYQRSILEYYILFSRILYAVDISYFDFYDIHKNTREIKFILNYKIVYNVVFLNIEIIYFTYQLCKLKFLKSQKKTFEK